MEKRFFTITEVAAEVGENASTLRYWEKEFRQLTPRTNARGKRFYSRKDIELIARIHALVRQQGFTIEGARKVLQGAVEPVPTVHGGEREAVLERLKALRARLVGALESVQLED